jgi:dTDP-4-amino-4,6-dideoxygalactose transaminase
MTPFLDLAAATAELRPALDAAIGRVLASGWFILGEEGAAFEHEFAAFTGAAACVGVGNGLDAIELSLRALGVGPGDEVIVPSNTFIATWLAVSRVGATIVPAEPLLATCNIDPARVADAVTPRTRAVIAVHLYGQPVEMEPLRGALAGRDIRLVEDAAQAHGGRDHGRDAGSLGDIAAWSFYPGKNLGALGDAGAVTTSDPALADAVRALRNYGSHAKYVHEIRGVNSRLDELQAAVLRAKLPSLREWNQRRARVAARYLEELADTSLVLPVVPDGVEPVWHLFVVRSDRRDALQAHLSEQGIQTLIHYPTPPHLQAAYRDLGLGEGAFPIAERIHRECLSLPIGPHITDDQVADVIDAVRSFRR